MNIKKYLGYLSASLLLLFISTAQAKTTIDVMALYSPAVTATYGSQADAETTIQHMINVSNGVYSDSDSDSLSNDIELNLVHVQESDLIDDNVGSSTVLSNAPGNATFQALRNQHGADIVVIFRPYLSVPSDRGLCGIAYVLGLSAPGFADFSYGHVSLGGICPTSVTVHEIGHTLGLSHSHLQDDNPNTGETDSRRPYGLGHGVNGRFATVMAYDFLFNTQNTVYKHSSPDLDCGNGFACGIAPGQQGEAHAVLALNEFAPNVANYRESKNINDDTDNGTDGGTDDGTDVGDTGETELEKAKREFDEAQATFLPIRETFIEKINAFRAAKAKVRNATTRAKRRAARAEKRAARADAINYRDETFRPAKKARNDARKKYNALLAAS